jgi:hypothetical protein
MIAQQMMVQRHALILHVKQVLVVLKQLKVTVKTSNKRDASRTVTTVAIMTSNSELSTDSDSCTKIPFY